MTRLCLFWVFYMFATLMVLGSLAAAAPPAPIGILGTLTYNGTPLEGAVVSCQALSLGEIVAQSSVSTTNRFGAWYSLLTVPESFVGSVQISILADDTYVEIIENVSAWSEFEVHADLLVDDSQVIPLTVTHPPFLGKESDADIEALTTPMPEEEVLEKYGDRIVPRVQPVASEQPSILPSVSFSDGASSSWFEFFVLGVLVLSLALLAGVVHHRLASKR